MNDQPTDEWFAALHDSWPAILNGGENKLVCECRDNATRDLLLHGVRLLSLLKQPSEETVEAVVKRFEGTEWASPLGKEIARIVIAALASHIEGK